MHLRLLKPADDESNCIIMNTYDHVLLTWATQYAGFSVGTIARAATLTHAILPARTMATDQTVIGRWLAWVLVMEEHMQHDMCVSGQRATEFWRGVRAVGERRAAPTSPFGLALNDIIANLVRLHGVTPADMTLLSIGVGTVLDGLALRYTWQQNKMTPDPEAERMARARSSGILGIYTLLSAMHGWGLAELLLSHPLRRMISNVELVAALLTEATTTHQIERIATLRTSIETTLRSLPATWNELSCWTTQIITGVDCWAAENAA